LKKREEFAVSLRKQKNKEIISAKRRRLASDRNDDHSNSDIYRNIAGTEA
jgi:hypothetical protein